MPRTLAARGSCAVARMAWPWRERATNNESAAPRAMQATKTSTFTFATPTSPSKKNQLPSPLSAMRSAPPKARAINCCKMMAMPNVASTESNMSRPMHDHRLEQDPAERIERRRSDRHGEKRRHPLLGAEHGDEAAE